MPRISAALADLEASLATSRYSTDLWVPEFGWGDDETEVSAKIHRHQKAAAYEIFLRLFGRPNKAWIHLAAEMQAGKTGVITALIRLMLNSENRRRVSITPDRMFVVTGMSDNAWLKQTKERLPKSVRDNVAHNGGLGSVQAALRRMAAREGGLKDVLIVLDESHLACRRNNRPAKILFQTLVDLCPPDSWADNNIRFVTISATDPAIAIGMAEEGYKPFASLVKLRTSKSKYQSVKKLLKEKRIYETFALRTQKDVKDLVAVINCKYEGTPLYHILRPTRSKTSDVKGWLEAASPGCQIIEWDSKSNTARSRTARGEEASSVTSTAEDINATLEVEPAVPTFILLKNMFYASKTMDDTYVGVLHDRRAAKDDTNLQSLLGRACGYCKSKRTIIFTSMQTVKNYLAIWRDIKPTEDLTVAAEAREVHGRMATVVATATGAGTSRLGVATTRAFPVSGTAATDGSSVGTRAARADLNEDHFTSEYIPCATFAEAKRIASRVHAKKIDEDGFYLSSTTGAAKRLSYNEVQVMMAGKKTANLPAAKLAVGETVSRLYVGYRDLRDPSSAVFMVRKLTRTV